jgi:predicted DNA-binding transcriptional regulator AlpA
VEDQGRAVTDHVVVTPEAPLAGIAGEVGFAAGDELVTESRAAELFGVSLRTLQAWRRNGTGPEFVRLSCRSIRYRHADLVAWVNARLKPRRE